MAERLEKEKEAARLAAEEKARKEAENSQEEVKRQVENLGNIIFSLNSSYLKESDKGILDQLVQILKDHPNIAITVEGHADSRGDDKYNQWLSERRAKRTADYLLSKGIAKNRIISTGFGETRLTNECDNSTPCSGEKHAKNRRSEFVIQQLD